MGAVKDLSYIKVTEFRNMLLYGLLPNINLFLSLETIAYFALYACGIRLLYGKRVFWTKTSMMTDQLLDRYYDVHEHYYTGLQNLILHLHSHYSPQYDHHGARYNIGIFGQEDLIGHISSNCHVTRYYGELIAYYYSIDFSLHNKTERKMPPDRLTDETNQNDGTYSDLDRYHQQICAYNTINKCVVVYRRCIIRDHMYDSLLYNKRRTSVSYFVQYCVNNDNKQHRFRIIKLCFRCLNKTYPIKRFQCGAALPVRTGAHGMPSVTGTSWYGCAPVPSKYRTSADWYPCAPVPRYFWRKSAALVKIIAALIIYLINLISSLLWLFMLNFLLEYGTGQYHIDMRKPCGIASALLL
ncbi:unnamed protein product [Didymodactylos carnosus]|uniref:Uncharacterized protein n=1 Tax=Didymodactylos carnosus TaxID=1234261 RepID=A0A8S2TK04_9BILA|nr:unnamed protein product [Didymodactylos carnosus]